MNNKLFVGNLSYDATENDLEELFSGAGSVVSVKIITDRNTGRSRGFAFVEMETEEQAQDAINTLDGAEVAGRPIKVSEARPQKPRNDYNNRD